MTHPEKQVARRNIAKARRSAHIKLFARECDGLAVDATTAALVAHGTRWVDHAKAGDVA